VPAASDQPAAGGTSNVQTLPAATPEFDPEAFAAPSVDLHYFGIVQGPKPALEPTVFIGAEYLMWTIKAPPTPPLITGSSNPADRAVLGAPSTNLLYGGHDQDLGPFSGVRAHFDWWVTDCLGVEAIATIFGSRKREYTAVSDGSGNPSLGVPFFDVTRGAENAILVSARGAQEGSVDARQTLRLYGFEANALFQNDCADNCNHLRAIAGVRDLDLRETLDLTTNTTFLRGGVGTFGGRPVPARAVVFGGDAFSTHDTFYGGQLGFEGEWRHEAVFLRLRTTCGLGFTHESLAIGGSSTLRLPTGATATLPGNTLALGSNIGRTTSDEFAVLPEVSVNIGVVVGDHLTLNAGYGFLYWSSVLRPGDQVDRLVNRAFVPTLATGAVTAGSAPVPHATEHGTDIWAHGFNVGATLMW
jgi:hypothetical protein